MCSSTLKYITIENDFIRQLATKRLNRLKLKWSLSNVSAFPGQDQSVIMLLMKLSERRAYGFGNLENLLHDNVVPLQRKQIQYGK